MKKDYILIKLKSGEEIVGRIVGKNRLGVRLSRPMQIKQIPMVDHIRGNVKGITVMENWIGRTDDLEVNIPTSMIGIRLTPSQTVIDAYDKYLNSEDMQNKGKSINPTLPLQDKAKEAALEEFEDELKRIVKDMVDTAGLPDTPIDDASNFFPSMGMDSKQDNKEKEMVIMNFMIPSKVFKNLAEDGIIEEIMNAASDFGDDDEEDMEDDVTPCKDKKVKDDKSPIRESGDEAFGNSFKDWSPDPNDYL